MLPARRTLSLPILIALAAACTNVGSGAECSDEQPCPSGSYCAEDGFCTSDCEVGGDDCPDGFECGADGQCYESGGDDCPDVTVNLEPVVPTVILLVDQSGSMTADFGENLNRYQALEKALVDPVDGVVTRLQDRVSFGATLYMSQGGDAGPTCPILAEVSPAVGSLGPITDLFADNEPTRDTPTAESVDATVAALDGMPDPRYIVLATDGDPDTCEFPDDNGKQGPKDLSEQAVQNAYAAGIETFILSVGTDVTESHLQRLANAGQGLDLATGTADFVVANNPTQLADSFDSIIRGTRSCEIELDAAVDPGRVDEGTVTLNGADLQFGTDWELVDERTIRLVGAACDDLRNTDTVELSASFPCGVVVD